MTEPTIWNQFFTWPITNLLILFYKLAESLGLPGPLGFSIIAMTIVSRIVLFPLISAQLKSAKQMAKLKPRLDELQKKHKNDRQALQKAQLELYKEHGVNPAAGCLPLLLQMPILIALYNVFYSFFASGEIEKITTQINQILYTPQLHVASLDLSFFGANLAIKPAQWQTNGLWLLSVPLVTGVLQWIQIKLSMAHNQLQQREEQEKKTKENKDQEPKKEEKNQEDMAAEIQKQMAIITPIMLGFFAYQFPIGLSLYWNLSSIFGIMQQQYINKTYA